MFAEIGYAMRMAKRRREINAMLNGLLPRDFELVITIGAVVFALVLAGMFVAWWLA